MVNTSNLETFGLFSTTKAAVFEIATNALAATVNAPIRKKSFTFIKLIN